jgi:hypothetical protein
MAVGPKVWKFKKTFSELDQNALNSTQTALLVASTVHQCGHACACLGQIYKTIHGLKSTAASEQSLFSEHTEGSLVCQAFRPFGIR